MQSCSLLDLRRGPHLGPNLLPRVRDKAGGVVVKHGCSRSPEAFYASLPQWRWLQVRGSGKLVLDADIEAIAFKGEVCGSKVSSMYVLLCPTCLVKGGFKW